MSDNLATFRQRPQASKKRIGLDSPAPVMERLAEIEEDLAYLQNDWEDAAFDVAKLTRDYKLRMALAYRATDKDLRVEDRKTDALLAVEEEPDGLADRLNEAEAKLAGCVSAFKTLDKRASIGQSILAAMREEGKFPRAA